MDFEFSIFKHLKIFIMLFNEKNLSLRKLLCSIGIVAVAQFMSCKTDDVEEVRNESSSPQQEQKEKPSLNYKALFSSNHTMGMDEARELALDAASLFAGEGDGLKSGRARQIEEVRVLRSDETTLRSGSGEVVAIPDTLAYVCNFADSAGFAIICADDRVGCPILAYVGEGTLGDEVENPGLAMVLANMEDYLIGSIQKFETEKDSLLQVAETQLQGDTTCLRRTYTGKYDLVSEESVAPLINTKWGQDAPYNSYVPLCPSGGHMLAGCVAIATAQIMAYYEFPKVLDGYSFNWKDMKYSSCAEYVSVPARNSIARLVQLIGTHVEMSYGCEGSGANMDNTLTWLRTLGYQTSNPSDYNWDQVKSCLDSQIPVIASGFRVMTMKKAKKKKKILGITVKTTDSYTPIYSDGHVWVIDGYKTTTIKSYSYTVNTVTDVTAIRYLSSSYSNSFLSVNWGWDGIHDDYYAAGCFDPGTYDYQYKQTIYIARR